MAWRHSLLPAATLTVLGALHAATPALAEGPAALPSIEVRPVVNGVEIIGRATAMSDGEVRGEMAINRRGQAGSVSTTQGSAVTLKAGEAREIAKVGISFSPGDVLEVVVTLKQNGSVIARSSLQVPGSNL